MSDRALGGDVALGGHVALSGASGDLGRALAARLARPGLMISLTGRNAERLGETARLCAAKGAEVATDAFDIRAFDRLEQWVRAADERRPLSLAIANAGVLHGHKRAHRTESFTEAREQIDVNLLGAMALLGAAADRMATRRGGRLLAISSLAGLQPLADEPAYSASKAGMNAYCEALREYLAEYGVGLTLACPGYIATAMGSGFKGARPMELDADSCARRILRAVERGRDLAAFPTPLLWSIRLGRLAPGRLRRLFTRGLRFKLEE